MDDKNGLGLVEKKIQHILIITGPSGVGKVNNYI